MEHPNFSNKEMNLGPMEHMSCEECGEGIDYQKGKVKPLCPEGHRHPHTHEFTMSIRRKYFGGFSISELEAHNATPSR